MASAFRIKRVFALSRVGEEEARSIAREPPDLFWLVPEELRGRGARVDAIATVALAALTIGAIL
jgi:hypothetical protein